MAHTISRWHEICAGHRVYGHEGKCANLHGHAYIFEFQCEAEELDGLGRVIDFSVIKSTLCQWLEDNWDHRLLLYDEDPLYEVLSKLDPKVVPLPLNPTAENLAMLMVKVVAPGLLHETGVRLVRCTVNETMKCSASYGIL